MHRVALVLAIALAACGKKSTVEHRRALPGVAITLDEPGMSASELEHVAQQVEAAVSGLAYVTRVSTRITAGNIEVTAECDPEVDRFEQLSAVQKAVGKIRAQLPPDAFPQVQHAGGRVIGRYEIRGVLPLEVVSLWSHVPELMLRSVSGVTDVVECGEIDPVLRIDVDLARTHELGIATSEVLDGLARLPSVSNTPLDLPLRDGHRLSEIATSQRTTAPATCIAATEHGRVIVGTIYADTGADPVAVRDAVEDRLRKLPQAGGVTFELLPRQRPISLRVDGGTPDMVVLALAPIRDIAHVTVEQRVGDDTPLTVELVPREDASDATIRDIEAAARSALGKRRTVIARSALTVQVFGADPTAIGRVRDHVARTLADHGVTRRGGIDRPREIVHVDRGRLATLGASPSDVMHVYRAMSDPGFPIGVRTSDPAEVYVHLVGPADLATVRERATIQPFNALSQSEEVSEPIEILRENGVRFVALDTNASEAEIRKALAAVKLPPGVVAKVVAVE